MNYYTYVSHLGFLANQRPGNLIFKEFNMAAICMNINIYTYGGHLGFWEFLNKRRLIVYLS